MKVRLKYLDMTFLVSLKIVLPLDVLVILQIIGIFVITLEIVTIKLGHRSSLMEMRNL